MTLNKNNKVLMGLSGGVDSTAAVLLLQQQGFEVTGLFFNVLKEQTKAAEGALAAAERLGIRLICKDVSDRFDQTVIRYFCEEYQKGRTPNPCVMCNETMKFQLLRETADEIGAYYLATGHYARVKKINSNKPEEELYYIQRGVSEKKDQSYMLYRLGQDIRSRLLLPLGDFSSKDEVRRLAHEHEMPNAEKKDSQEICFIREENYVDFLEGRGNTGHPGDFINQQGQVIGRHQGIMHYTIGQRKGLGSTFGKPMFVTKVDHKKNMVTLGENEDLFSRTIDSLSNVYAYPLSFLKFTDQDNIKDVTDAHDPTNRPNGFACRAKIRYAAPLADCKVFFEENGLVKTVFDKPQRAATPGQSIVFYSGDLVIGGGLIESAEA